MKKFATPLCITGTLADFEAIIPELNKMGYKASNVRNALQYEPGLFLVTNYSGEKDRYAIDSNDTGFSRIKVDASNRELVFALAAMVDDKDDRNFREPLVCLSGQHRSFTRGKIYLAFGYNSGRVIADDDGDRNGLPRDYFRKATREEIIGFYSKNMAARKISDLPNSNGSELLCAVADEFTKKQIGWRVKNGIKRDGIERLLSNKFPANRDFDFSVNSSCEDMARHAGVLELLFEPVYEEKSWKTGDLVYVVESYGGSGAQDAIAKIVDINTPCENGALSNTVILKAKLIKSSCYNGVIWGFSKRCKLRAVTKEELNFPITLSCEGGSFEIEVSEKGLYYRPENAWLDLDTIRQIVLSWKTEKRRQVSVKKSTSSDSVGSPANLKYTFTYVSSHIDSGCKKNVPIADWAKVVDAYHVIIL